MASKLPAVKTSSGVGYLQSRVFKATWLIVKFLNSPHLQGQWELHKVLPSQRRRGLYLKIPSLGNSEVEGGLILAVPMTCYWAGMFEIFSGGKEFFTLPQEGRCKLLALPFLPLKDFLPLTVTIILFLSFHILYLMIKSN